MGAARKAILKVGQEIGAIKEQGQPVTAQNLGLEKPEKKSCCGNYGRKARRGQTPRSPHWQPVIVKRWQTCFCLKMKAHKQHWGRKCQR
jgi:hypothetical protein